MAQYVLTMNRVGKVVPPRRTILKDISISFFPGAKIGLLGLNGSGKSTVAKMVVGLIPPPRAVADHAGVLNVAGPEAVSRAELGALVARWRGIDPARLATSRAADLRLARPADVRLDSRRAAGLLTTRLRAVSELFAA